MPSPKPEIPVTIAGFVREGKAHNPSIINPVGHNGCEQALNGMAILRRPLSPPELPGSYCRAHGRARCKHPFSWPTMVCGLSSRACAGAFAAVGGAHDQNPAPALAQDALDGALPGCGNVQGTLGHFLPSTGTDRNVIITGTRRAGDSMMKECLESWSKALPYSNLNHFFITPSGRRKAGTL